ncbi:MAG TPA: DUF5134 domain-containing protein [Solirubrobacteraceae bacterium]|jgi:hypothetical protein|nr:DUF5134 domain-containing protein [Solirubrobacteraceae bacterium]
MGSSMNMTSGNSSMQMTGARGAAGAAHGTLDLLPQWLAIAWTIVFVAALVIHTRHVLESHGQRRFWHSAHVLMALGMIFMFAPASIDRLDIPSGFWQLLFANAAAAALAWILAQALGRQVVNVLWILIATDLAAMVYMWSASGFVAPITWLLVAYFAAQTAAWATNRMRQADDLAIGRRFSVDSAGAVAATASQPLVCDRDLRVSVGVMTLGMAYMFAAMQLQM